MGDPLTGHVLLIAEPRIGQYALDLQVVPEGRGAQTPAVCEPAREFERTREYLVSAGVLNRDHASDSLHTLIADLSEHCDIALRQRRRVGRFDKRGALFGFHPRWCGADHERPGPVAAAGSTPSGCASRAI
jgi:hypothetical protein